MPTEREAGQPKLEIVRLEDRLTPAGALTTDTLLSFAPNPVLDLGGIQPDAPVGAGTVSTPAASTPATVAPTAPVLAASQYELILPTSSAGSPTTDSSGGALALFSVTQGVARLSGYVYEDEGANGGTRDDGVKQAGEPGIPGTPITLLRVVSGVTFAPVQTTTDANGFYEFTSLVPFGEYRVVEAVQPANYLDGKDTAGTVGGVTRGVAGNEIISGITLNDKDVGVNYNFGELLPRGALSGFVYVDEGANGGTRDDGVKQPGEAPIPGTPVTLFRVVNGQTVSLSQTTTDGNGFYRFINLVAGGGYLVRETQPTAFLDGKDTPGSTGGNNTVNDQLSAIVVPPNGESINNNFGELAPPPPAKLSGYVYVDLNNDGVRDPNEEVLRGVTLTLFRVANGTATSVAQTVTNPLGFYEFSSLPPGNYEVRETQPADYLDGKDTPGSKGGSNATNDVLTAIPLLAGDNSVNNNFGELLPARLSGFEYVDEGEGLAGVRDDGVKQGGEPGIPGVLITLTGTDDRGAAVSLTATTGVGGFYSFGNLRPGTYTVTAAQPVDFTDGKDTAGTVGGGTRGTAGNDVISNINLNANENSVENNFGELLPRGALSGFVYVDEGANGGTRDDGVKQPGEAPIPGTPVTLFRVVGGQTVSLGQTTTDANGFYRFTNLAAGGGYLVRETQPAAFLDGKDTPGSTGGNNTVNDQLSAIVVPANGESINNNFGELAPIPIPAKLSGFVYEDLNNNGVKDPNEPGIAGVAVGITGVLTNGQLWPPSITLTDANGFYEFTGLPAGSYRVDEVQPVAYLDGLDTPGSKGGNATVNDQIAAIPLVADDNSVNNNFGERRGSISGFVYVDEGANGGTRDDGVKQAGEPGIGGVVVRLLKDGVQQATATTGPDGSYRFDRLLLGTGYTVQEVAQPAGFDDGKDTAGVPGGGTAGNEVISNITLTQLAPNSPDNNFGELVPVPVQLGTLSGFVYVDEGANGGTRDDGVKQPGEAPIPGTPVTLFRVVNGQTVSLGQTTTDANGFYRFINLVAGGGYLVRETQPTAFLDGKDTPGSTGGNNTVNDELSAVVVPPNGESQNNNFGELVPPPPLPARLSGFVYEDNNNDGVRDAAEAPIPGTTVTLFRVVNGTTTSVGQTTTDASGFYQFTALEAGTYEVRETQPAAYLDGKDTPGTKGGSNAVNDRLSTIPLNAGDDAVNNNFGELRPARLSGFEYVDEGANGGTRDDGVKQAGEPGIPNTVVVLTGTDDLGGVSRTATTAADGSYSFENLRPGTYTVTSAQPTGFNDGKDTAGSKGGAVTNDQIATIPLVAGDNSVNNNFGELVPPPPPPPPLPARLSGFVYVDANNNGLRDLGEAPIAGVTVRIGGVTTGGVTTGIIATTTDANGFYEFTNLAAGTYGLQEVQPNGFLDGLDTPGSTGGGAPQNDTLTSVPLPSGANSINNNFGELLPPPVVRGDLNGYVYEDTNDNGVKDAGEAGIPGVVLELRATNTTGEIGLPAPTFATTDANGFYQFTGLNPSPAFVYEVREAQPANYLDGLDTPGNTGGNNGVNDVLSAVPVPAGGVSANNNFGELKPVSLYGYVWFDANRNGRFDPSERGLPGATVTLTGTTASGRPITTALAGGNPLSVTTDSFGRYSFPFLPAGNYSVVQTNTPPNSPAFTDFASENAARLTVAGSTPTQFVGVGLNRDAGPLNFGKTLPVPVIPVSPVSPIPSKQNFLGSSGGTADVTVQPATPGQQLPASEAGPFNPAPIGPTTGRRIYATGSGAGTPSVVRVFDAATGGEVFRVNPFESEFRGGVTTAIGDVNADGFDDVIVGAGAGGGPRVRVFDGKTGATLYDFFAYSPNFTGGVFVASGDVNGDGFDDIITGAGAGGGPHVKAISGKTGQDLYSFFAFDQSYTGGARVAVGDFNGDGIDDIAAGTGVGVASQVITFDGRNAAVISRLAPFESAFQGGVNLGAGDVDGDGKAEVIAGAASGGGPRVRVMNATTGASVYDFFAAETTFGGGVSVAARDLDADGKAEIITGTGVGIQARIQVFSGANLSRLDSFFAFESTVNSGVFVG